MNITKQITILNNEKCPILRSSAAVILGCNEYSSEQSVVLSLLKACMRDSNIEVRMNAFAGLKRHLLNNLNCVKYVHRYFSKVKSDYYYTNDMCVDNLLWEICESVINI